MARPDRVYVTIAAVGAFVSTLAFTITPFYRFQVAGLDNFELVLAGTLMEAAVFCFEIPTGVVADQWSRKWSVIVGHLGIGLGLLIEASFAVGRRCPRRPGRVGHRLHVHERGDRRLARPPSSTSRTGSRSPRCSCGPAGSGPRAALVAVPLAFLLGGVVAAPADRHRRRHLRRCSACG